MTAFNKDLGAMLRTMRLAKNATQESVAKLLGVTRSAYSYYESGKTSPDLHDLRVLAEFFGIPPADFFYPELYADPEDSGRRVQKSKPLN